MGREKDPDAVEEKKLSPGLGFTVMQNQLATAAKTLKNREKRAQRENVRQNRKTKE